MNDDVLVFAFKELKIAGDDQFGAFNAAPAVAVGDDEFGEVDAAPAPAAVAVGDDELQIAAWEYEYGISASEFSSPAPVPPAAAADVFNAFASLVPAHATQDSDAIPQMGPPSSTAAPAAGELESSGAAPSAAAIESPLPPAAGVAVEYAITSVADTNPDETAKIRVGRWYYDIRCCNLFIPFSVFTACFIEGLYRLESEDLKTFYNLHPGAEDVMRLPGKRVGKFFKKNKAECMELGLSWVCRPDVHSHLTVQATAAGAVESAKAAEELKKKNEGLQNERQMHLMTMRPRKTRSQKSLKVCNILGIAGRALW
jgi:hypothetical protein